MKNTHSAKPLATFTLILNLRPSKPPTRLSAFKLNKGQFAAAVLRQFLFRLIQDEKEWIILFLNFLVDAHPGKPAV